MQKDSRRKFLPIIRFIGEDVRSLRPALCAALLLAFICADRHFSYRQLGTVAVSLGVSGIPSSVVNAGMSDVSRSMGYHCAVFGCKNNFRKRKSTETRKIKASIHVSKIEELPYLEADSASEKEAELLSQHQDFSNLEMFLSS